jgi:hypothetical protein
MEKAAGSGSGSGSGGGSRRAIGGTGTGGGGGTGSGSGGESVSGGSASSPSRRDGPEWDHASKSCVLCAKPFGVFNRKHHCRKCGRLVCEPCSSKKLVLSLDNQNGGAPQRVCEGCYKTLTRKKVIKEEATNQKEREDAILRESSKVFLTLSMCDLII